MTKHSVPLITACCAALIVTVPMSAFGFGTVEKKRTLGQSSEHERITRGALAGAGFGPNTLNSLAGRGGTFGAVGAADIPGRGLFTESKAHCDNGDFLDVPGYPQSKADAQAQLEVCRAWIMLNLSQALSDAGGLVKDDLSLNLPDVSLDTFACRFNGARGRDKCNVLQEFGLALHTSQDFYSHSNWADVASSDPISETNPPGLGHTERAPWLDPRKRLVDQSKPLDDPANAGAEPFPDGLITGCFTFVPESNPLLCKYNTLKSTRVKHAVLNKDEGPINITPGVIGPGTTQRGMVGTNFAQAVNAAMADTTDKWAYLSERILALYGAARGQKILCVIQSDDPTTCT